MPGIQGRILEVHTPLVVDLDGTLLRSDMLFETAVAFIRNHPLKLFSLFTWLLQGKASLKQGLALGTEIDVALLPFNADVIDYIQTKRQTGRSVILATASHETLANRIAAHLQLFDQVWASDGRTNLSAHRKRDLLVSHYGEQGFDYIGNSGTICASGVSHARPSSPARLPVWSARRGHKATSSRLSNRQRPGPAPGARRCACTNG